MKPRRAAPLGANVIILAVTVVVILALVWTSSDHDTGPLPAWAAAGVAIVTGLLVRPVWRSFRGPRGGVAVALTFLLLGGLLLYFVTMR